jgi:quercetin dioxygenase-like cupin family protein
MPYRGFLTVRSHDWCVMAAQVEIVGPHGGEVVLPGPNEMRIVQDGASTGHRLGVGVITMAPRTPGPSAHRHDEHDEGFYVIAGTPRFTDHDGVGHDAPAGTWILAPRGAAHSFANPGEQQAIILNTFTPDRYLQYFRDARELIDSEQGLTPEAASAVRERYATHAAE